MVQLYFKFRSRPRGSFGTSPVGRVAEWITTTWLRFTCFLIVSIIVILVSPSNLATDQKALIILASPVFAIFYWYGLLFCILISRYLGIFGRVFANVLVIYIYLFSRLIAQRPPIVGLGLTPP